MIYVSKRLYSSATNIFLRLPPCALKLATMAGCFGGIWVREGRMFGDQEEEPDRWAGYFGYFDYWQLAAGWARHAKTGDVHGRKSLARSEEEEEVVTASDILWLRI